MSRPRNARLFAMGAEWPSEAGAAAATDASRSWPCCRNSRDARRLCVSAQVGEEKSDFALGGLRGVGAVDEVLPDLEREVAADAARRALDRVGDAHQRAYGLVRARPFGHERDQRATRDEVDQLTEE